MSEQALITSADVWEMKDEMTGVVRKGLSVWYLNDYREDTSVAFGVKPTKISASLDLLGSVQNKLPGVFDLEFGSRPGANGKATLTLTGLKFIRSFDLFGSSVPLKS